MKFTKILSAAVQAVVDVRSHSVSSESERRLQMTVERQEDFEIVHPRWRFEKERESEWCDEYNRYYRPAPGLASKLWDVIQNQIVDPLVGSNPFSEHSSWK